MLKILSEIKKLIGNTPVVKLQHDKFNLYAKLENYNFSGSIKDRAVYNIIYNGILAREIVESTKIIESSSGNFAISAALVCKRLGLDFISVVDPCINRITYKKLKLLAKEVIQVSEVDETGGYLLNRISLVKEIIQNNSEYFWPNQYENIHNYGGYKELADEIKRDFKELSFLFVAVSSTGTLAGLIKYLKSILPDLTIVAIDVKGSMIFSNEKHDRYISGIGASRKSSFLTKEDVDEVVILDDFEIIEGCHQLLNKHAIFSGGSSGGCYYGALKFLNNLRTTNSNFNSLIICPDGGTAYLDSVYNDQWLINRQMSLTNIL